MPIEIVPFHADMIAQAGTLLAQRHTRDRAVQPSLPARFEQPAASAGAVAATWGRTHASGVAALQNGQLAGYMIGDMVMDEVWGRAGWVRLPGWALAPEQSTNLIGDMYAVLAQRWVDYGCFAHFALVPARDQALNSAWFGLCFGIEQIYGLLPLEDRSSADTNANLEIRRAAPRDRAILGQMASIIWEHQTRAPVWGIMLPEMRASRPGDYADLVDDPEATVWLAFAGDEPLGFQAYFPAEPADDDLLTPDQGIELGVAGTFAAARGRGVGQALTRHGLAHAQAIGYRTCLTDWRSTNLLSSRFWPRQGFLPAVNRLVRRIDPRIAWANDRALPYE